MRSIYITLLIVAAFGCGRKEQETVAEQTTAQTAPADSTSSPSDVAYRYELISAPENTFGYDVFKDDALFIHQPHIPGMPGVKGFEKEEQAKKAAALMIEKMEKGIVPPTLSEEEINGILNN